MEVGFCPKVFLMRCKLALSLIFIDTNYMTLWLCFLWHYLNTLLRLHVILLWENPAYFSLFFMKKVCSAHVLFYPRSIHDFYLRFWRIRVNNFLEMFVFYRKNPSNSLLLLYFPHTPLNWAFFTPLSIGHALNMLCSLPTLSLSLKKERMWRQTFCKHFI